MTFLEVVSACKREEVARSRRARPISSLPASRAPRDFAAALRQPGLSVIAEIKRRSPSKGILREDLDPAALALTYEQAGAAAISCLTDESFFGARDDDLPRASAATTVPILRKEFIVDEYQLYESRSLGADAVLLIVRMLEAARLADLLTLCRELRLAALVEVHSESELEAALCAGAGIIGVNNRNLDSLEVDLATSIRLRPMIPADHIAVAESGISQRRAVLALEQSGFDAMLIGETLVTARDPGRRLRELRGVER